MSDELQIKSTNLPQQSEGYSQSGDNNLQIANVNTLNYNNPVMILTPPNLSQNVGTSLSPMQSLNYDFYHLFVIGKYVEFITGSMIENFIVEKDRALTESISDCLKKKYATLRPDAIQEMKLFPAIFANENRGDCKTDLDHLAYLGLVHDIKIQDNGIKIYARILTPIQQQKLNELASDLAIKGASKCNELNRTHWTIKQVNLIEVLKGAGINTFPL